MGLFGYFGLKMKTGRSCCLGWSRPVVFVNPLLLRLVLDDSIGYQPHRRIFSWGFGLPVKPSSMCDRSRSRSRVGTRRGIPGRGAACSRLTYLLLTLVGSSVHCILRPLGSLRAVMKRDWSNWVYTRSFDLSIKASFSVNFGSHSLDSKG